MASMSSVFSRAEWAAVATEDASKVQAAALALGLPPPWITPRCGFDIPNSIPDIFARKIVSVLTDGDVIDFDHPGAIGLGLSLYRSAATSVTRWAACWLMTSVDVGSVAQSLGLSQSMSSQMKLEFTVHASIHLLNLALQVPGEKERALLLADIRDCELITGVIAHAIQLGLVEQLNDGSLAPDTFAETALDDPSLFEWMWAPLLMAQSIRTEPNCQTWDMRERFRGALLEMVVANPNLDLHSIMQVFQQVVAGPGKGDYRAVIDLQWDGWTESVLSSLGSHVRRHQEHGDSILAWRQDLGERAEAAESFLNLVSTFGIDD